MLDVSIVIPTYNRRALLREAIVSLFQQSYPKNKYEIIIVDNSSTDGTEQLIKDLQNNAPCSIRYYKKENKGPGPARNLGIRNAKGDIIAFTDSDCIADTDWLKNGISKFSDNSIAFVSGKILPKPGQTVSFLSPFIYVTAENPIYPTNNIFYRKDVLVAAGGFDEQFGYPTGGEDTDVAWRVKRQGWGNLFSHDVVIYHEVHRFRLLDYVYKDTWRWRKVPLLASRVPELRETLFYLKIFINPRMPLFYMSIVGVLSTLFFAHGIFLSLTIPYLYILLRGLMSEFKKPAGIVKGLVKLNVIIIRDFMTAVTFIYGSIRYRYIVL